MCSLLLHMTKLPNKNDPKENAFVSAHFSEASSHGWGNWSMRRKQHSSHGGQEAEHKVDSGDRV